MAETKAIKTALISVFHKDGLDEILRLLANDGVKFLSTGGTRSFIEEQGYTFPVYYDTDMDAAMAYGISAIPMTYFIDGDGNAVAYYQGAMSAEVLQQGIEKLLAGE